MSARLTIGVLPGDGIGTEVMPPCLDILGAALALVGRADFRFVELEAGAGCFRRHGEALPGESLSQARAADALLLGAMGLPDVRYEDGTEIAPQLELRERLGLYAGVRPIRTRPGVAPVLADPRAAALDIVLVRESTEGLFAFREHGVVSDDEATDTLKISRRVSERLFDFSFELARDRKSRGHAGRVTCVDKANVLNSFAFFRRIFAERARRYADLTADYCYVDAAGLNLVKCPWTFDVMVTENMFGDILSDVGAALMGGMGMAPSADIGDSQAVFQPCHGSAPDIMGKGVANPTAMVLSGAMLLDWLGRTRDDPALRRAGDLVEAAVDNAYAGGDVRPYELGGDDGTVAIANAFQKALGTAR
ncbi:MAG: isocitrate/isopropylmalate dehydrogenase family protein [Pseudomonadota bacterium]